MANYLQKFRELSKKLIKILKNFHVYALQCIERNYKMHKFNFCRISFNLAINTEQLLENNLKEEQTAKKYFQYFIFSQFEEWGNYYSVTDNSRRSSNSSGSRVEKKWKSFRHLHKILQANNMRKKTSSSALLCAICSLSRRRLLIEEGRNFCRICRYFY